MLLLDVLSHEYMDLVYLAAFIALLGWAVRRQNRAGARSAALTTTGLVLASNRCR